MKKILLFSLFICICSACNVTRTTTTKSEYYQKGDTAVTIQTKTTETYTAEKKLN